VKYLTINNDWADGGGSQIQRRMSIWAYCKLNNIQYVHTPVFPVEHNYDEDGSFEDKWENFFNLGHGELSLDDVDESELSYVESMNEYFDESGVDLYDKLRDDFFEKYFLTEKPKLVFDEDKVNVAVHVRRPAYRAKQQEDRKISDEYYISVMESIKEEAQNSDRECKFYIYSVSPKHYNFCRVDIYREYRNLDMDIELVIDGCPFSDMHHMMMSDVLVTSKSSFSYLPALFTGAKVFYHKFWHEPKSYWVVHNEKSEK
jgi:hypothetical protein